jgi:hypothetical protein
MMRLHTSAPIPPPIKIFERPIDTTASGSFNIVARPRLNNVVLYLLKKKG